jgi:Tfp pilus assembly protein PilE
MSGPPRQRRVRREGFTLLETVVVLFLLSLSAVVILESYRAGLGMWERQHQGARSLESAAVVMDRVRSQLVSYLDHQYRQETADRRKAFRGEAERLEFATLVGLSSGRDPGMIHLVRYQFEAGGEEGGRLVLKEFSWPRSKSPGDEEPVLEDALRGVTEFRLRYQVSKKRKPAPGGGKEESLPPETRWTDAWPQDSTEAKDETLTAVAVSLSVEMGGRQEKLSATVPVMAGRQS